MDAYPAYSLTQNIPLLVTIGLPAVGDSGDDTSSWTLDAELKDQATLLRSELPVLDGKPVTEFSRYISTGDVSGPVPAGSQKWRGRASSQRYRFRVRTAGRTYYFPPRRARLPENFEAPEPQSVVLHSPFSPLSPSCHLYPDGIIDFRWIQKHQEIVPSVFLCFYSLTSDPTTATLQDNKIKSDINAFRTAVQQSGYRSRVAVAVFFTAPGDDSNSSTDGVAQERLENIRKGSGTDTKMFFAIPATTAAGAPADELHRVAENMLTNVYTVAMDYYRELGRHLRKKRGRGSAPQPSVPPTSGTSQTLSLAGWHVRYDVKAAVIAEFRQETDAALRLLDQAYENLLGPEVLAEAIPHWSPRWNEARLLVDTLAVRSLRCLLMAGQYSSAVRRWTVYRDRLRNLLDTRGRGTANYGWQAWEARWAVVMADLIRRVGVPELDPRSGRNLFLLPERNMIAERLAPWEFLHHRGYWYRIAARHTAARRALAHQIPDDDRRPPDVSPASHVANRAFSYDDYMCPPPHSEYPLAGHGPGVNHSAAIVTYLELARDEFLQRRQTHVAAELALECGREYVSAKQWDAAVDLLAPLWTSSSAATGWSSWLDVREDLAWTLRTAVAELEEPRPDLLVSIDWELLHAQYTRRPDWAYDVAKSLPASSKGVQGQQEADSVPVAVKLPEGTPPPSFLSAAFVFKNGEGKAGEAALAQLTIRSDALANSVPIVLEELHLQFNSSIKPIVLRHSADATATFFTKGKTTHSTIHLEEEDEDDPGAGTKTINGGDDDDETRVLGLHGSANLTLQPQSTLVFELAIPLRQPGDAHAVSADLVYRCPLYSLQMKLPLASYVAGEGSRGRTPTWFLPRAGGRVSVPRADSQAIKILPRPPKLDIQLLHAPVATAAATPIPTVQYYTNEAIDLALELVNAEDADASVKLDVIMEGGSDEAGASGSSTPGFTLLVAGDEIDTAEPQTTDIASPTPPTAMLRSVPLGHVKAGHSVAIAIRIPPTTPSMDLDLTLRAAYHLVSDTATPITQQLSVKLSLSNPFEANYDLLPRMHPAAWPSLFDNEGIVATGTPEDADAVNRGFHGLTQAWALVTRYASFATEDLRVVDLDLVIQPEPRISVQHTRTDAASHNGNDNGTPQTRDADGALTIKPQTMEESRFDLVVQKASLDDRDPVQLDVSFVITWQRLAPPGSPAGSAGSVAPLPTNTTTLPVPQLSLFGTEPRVLASVAYSRPSAPVPAIQLTLAIENASNHFLTFGVSMEPSADFAFSGAKLTTIHVLPMSRRATSYRLVPLVRGAWIRPALVVRDKYFQKVLRILPTEGMKMDKDGILIWVPPDAEEEEEEESGKEEDADGGKGGAEATNA
ncbi:solute carrier family 25, member 38 [Sporothrix schenckii 1099-18]|uniref:Solute carrier family 25, member 38 n=1 Tax=Sporothrix schenckii 1099-18 TaxID=1397361 RepID=A0A0F2MJA7_SPOSC|nr:solute carrier family 25, member 38 [Sporothrix schenckii 1099-18]KJR88261.1 solute carrier family 25, member 38 [Sporothrix schenckii 1099-18]